MRSLPMRTLACIFAVSFAGCGSPGEQGSRVARVGSPVPHFSVTAIDGTTVTSESLDGEVVILNFWSTVCPSCLSEIPVLNELASQPGVKVLGIALDQGGMNAVKSFVQRGRHRVGYAVALGDEELFQRFDGFNIPYTLIVDRSRRVARIYRGPVHKETLEEAVKLIKQTS
jgi:thiol-disulfide isomerase/thioredoxin